MSVGLRLLVAGMLVALAMGAGSPVMGAVEEARILRVGTLEDIDSLNPNLALIDVSAEASELQYDTLVGIDPERGYAPTGFADGWSSDGTSWTFTIRDGMRWSDGEVADASDVAFTFQYLLSSLDPAYIGPWAPTGNDLTRPGATRPDGRADHPLSLYGDPMVRAAGLRSVQLEDHTVTLTTAHPTTLLLGAMVPILPEHIWSSVPFAIAASDVPLTSPVVGSGPFQVVDRQRARSLTFARNPDYWGPTPSVEEIRFQVYPDVDALVAALERGDIDYARDIPPDDFDDLDARADIDAVEGLATGFTHLAFNTYAAPIDGGGASTSAVRDPRFRDALGYALDPDAIINAAVDGHATPGTTLIPPGLAPFHSEPTSPRRFDVAEARRRLEVAGFTDADGDGIREDPEGHPIDLRLVYPTSDPRYAAAAVVVAADWEAIGVGVTPQGLKPDTLEELLYTPEAGGTAEYDVELWSWSGSPDPDFLLSLLTTAQIGRSSDSSYANPAYDRLFDAQRRAPSVEERIAVVRQMADLAYADAPYLVLFYDDPLHAQRTDRFSGWASAASGDVSLFTGGVAGYLDLVPVAGDSGPSHSPVPPAPASPPVTSGESGSVGATATPGMTTLALIGALLAVAIAIVAVIGTRRRRGA